MKCPFCQSDNLENFTEDRKELESMAGYLNRGGKITICCDDCGGSFQVVSEPQDILLEDALKNRMSVCVCTSLGIGLISLIESNIDDLGFSDLLVLNCAAVLEDDFDNKSFNTVDKNTLVVLNQANRCPKDLFQKIKEKLSEIGCSYIEINMLTPKEYSI